MTITCSPQGFTDINRPNQAINDLKKAGFEMVEAMQDIIRYIV